MTQSEGTHYTLLGIAATATRTEIRKAYRTLALECHPDKVDPSERDAATERFQHVSEAYATLHDERKRLAYDHALEHRDGKKEGAEAEGAEAERAEWAERAGYAERSAEKAEREKRERERVWQARFDEYARGPQRSASQGTAPGVQRSSSQRTTPGVQRSLSQRTAPGVQRSSSQRTSRTQQTVRPDRPDRPDRVDRPERPERFERSGEPTRQPSQRSHVSTGYSEQTERRDRLRSERERDRDWERREDEAWARSRLGRQGEPYLSPNSKLAPPPRGPPPPVPLKMPMTPMTPRTPLSRSPLSPQAICPCCGHHTHNHAQGPPQFVHHSSQAHAHAHPPSHYPPPPHCNGHAHSCAHAAHGPHNGYAHHPAAGHHEPDRAAMHWFDSALHELPPSHPFSPSSSSPTSPRHPQPGYWYGPPNAPPHVRVPLHDHDHRHAGQPHAHGSGEGYRGSHPPHRSVSGRRSHSASHGRSGATAPIYAMHARGQSHGSALDDLLTNLERDFDEMPGRGGATGLSRAASFARAAAAARALNGSGASGNGRRGQPAVTADKDKVKDKEREHGRERGREPEKGSPSPHDSSSDSSGSSGTSGSSSSSGTSGELLDDPEPRRLPHLNPNGTVNGAVNGIGSGGKQAPPKPMPQPPAATSTTSLLSFPFPGRLFNSRARPHSYAPLNGPASEAPYATHYCTTTTTTTGRASSNSHHRSLSTPMAGQSEPLGFIKGKLAAAARLNPFNRSGRTLPPPRLVAARLGTPMSRTRSPPVALSPLAVPVVPLQVRAVPMQLPPGAAPFVPAPDRSPSRHPTTPYDPHYTYAGAYRPHTHLAGL